MRQVLVSLSCWAASTLSFAGCFEETGRRYNIDPLLLRAIAQVESNMNPAAVNHNANHSIDYGLMQVNSIHLVRLNARGISSSDLLDKPCVSVYVGAEILSGFIRRHGYNWTAVGAYNAGSRPSRAGLRQRYAWKVAREYRKLIDQQQRGTWTSHAERRDDTSALPSQPSARAHVAIEHLRTLSRNAINSASQGWVQTLFRSLARHFSARVRL